MLNDLAKAGSFFYARMQDAMRLLSGLRRRLGTCHAANICLSLKTKLSNFQHRFVPIPKY